jgi:hypothetical protein
MTKMSWELFKTTFSVYMLTSLILLVSSPLYHPAMVYLQFNVYTESINPLLRPTHLFPPMMRAAFIGTISLCLARNSSLDFWPHKARIFRGIVPPKKTEASLQTFSKMSGSFEGSDIFWSKRPELNEGYLPSTIWIWFDDSYVVKWEFFRTKCEKGAKGGKSLVSSLSTTYF